MKVEPKTPDLNGYPVCPRCEKEWRDSKMAPGKYAYCHPCNITFDFGDNFYWDLPSDMYDIFPPADYVCCRWDFQTQTTDIFNDPDPNRSENNRTPYWEYKFPWLPFDIDKNRLRKLLLLL